jgi:hypothetical protein
MSTRPAQSRLPKREPRSWSRSPRGLRYSETSNGPTKFDAGVPIALCFPVASVQNICPVHRIQSFNCDCVVWRPSFRVCGPPCTFGGNSNSPRAAPQDCRPSHGGGTGNKPRRDGTGGARGQSLDDPEPSEAWCPFFLLAVEAITGPIGLFSKKIVTGR